MKSVAQPQFSVVREAGELTRDLVSDDGRGQVTPSQTLDELGPIR
jgi:hypothetical protein